MEEKITAYCLDRQVVLITNMLSYDRAEITRGTLGIITAVAQANTTAIEAFAHVVHSPGRTEVLQLDPRDCGRVWQFTNPTEEEAADILGQWQQREPESLPLIALETDSAEPVEVALQIADGHTLLYGIGSLSRNPVRKIKLQDCRFRFSQTLAEARKHQSPNRLLILGNNEVGFLVMEN